MWIVNIYFEDVLYKLLRGYVNFSIEFISYGNDNSLVLSLGSNLFLMQLDTYLRDGKCLEILIICLSLQLYRFNIFKNELPYITDIM